MPALPSLIVEPLWDQVSVLLPVPVDSHPWGCHRPRVPDRVVVDKLIQVLVLGVAYERDRRLLLLGQHDPPTA